MKRYTMETLKAINGTYHHNHRLTNEETDEVNQKIAVIERSRSGRSPKPGDIVEYTDRYGNYFEHGHIESIKNGEMHICTRPMAPYITAGEHNALRCTTSGGPWTHIPESLDYVGKREKEFWHWGRLGACANGGIHFKAFVNVWRYAEAELPYTTKTHDKFTVYTKKETDPSNYKYRITKQGSTHTAFRTDEEYAAWLNTFHGVEEDSLYANSITVWTFKQSQQYVSLEAYRAIKEAVTDTDLCNGTIQECKRVYEGTNVTTYMPFQNERIEKNGQKRYQATYER